MKHAFLDRYARLDSPIHRIAPSTKIILSMCMLAILLLILPLLNPGNKIIGFSLYCCMMLIIAFMSRVPLLFLVSRSALVLPFSVLIIVVNYVSGHFELNQMLETLPKSLFSLFTLLLLTSTTPFHKILKQLSVWGTPSLLVTILAFMYRYFFLLAGEIEALERAIRMRRSSGSGWSRIRMYANIVGMLLVRSFERAERVYQAMQMRGFSGTLRS